MFLTVTWFRPEALALSVRNYGISYDGASVGYPSKDYNYDNNILCHEPPGWPPLQCEGDSEELDIKITGSITGKN